MSRDFKKHPRTVAESLALIVQAAKERRLCKHRYVKTADNTVCLLGALFTNEQLSWIVKKRLNNRQVSILAKNVGINNVMCMTGMTLAQLKVLQREFDNSISNDNIIKRIKQALKRQQKTMSVSYSFCKETIPLSQQLKWDKKHNKYLVVT